MKYNGKIKIFCDFDGTISQKDISDEIFKEFGNYEKNIKRLISKEIDIKEYWKYSFEDINNGVKIDEIIKFVNQMDIDANFEKFVDFCKLNEIELHIVSDGFEFYIKPFFENFNFNELKIFCNKELIDANSRIKPLFPGATEGCNCFSAICKRNVVLNNSDDDEISIYIGDGFSDYCGAEHSDIIFAKKNLAAYCNEHKLPHYPFKNFFDILRILNQLINSNKLRKRHQAILKRNSSFFNE